MSCANMLFTHALRIFLAARAAAHDVNQYPNVRLVPNNSATTSIATTAALICEPTSPTAVLSNKFPNATFTAGNNAPPAAENTIPATNSATSNGS